MKYIVLYSTQINNEFKAKDTIIEFPQGADEGYINRLVALKVIAPKQGEEQEKQGELIAGQTKQQEYKQDKQNSPKAGKKNNKE